MGQGNWLSETSISPNTDYFFPKSSLSCDTMYFWHHIVCLQQIATYEIWISTNTITKFDEEDDNIIWSLIWVACFEYEPDFSSNVQFIHLGTAFSGIELGTGCLKSYLECDSARKCWVYFRHKFPGITILHRARIHKLNKKFRFIESLLDKKPAWNAVRLPKKR
jgi:hypothetical protein